MSRTRKSALPSQPSLYSSFVNGLAAGLTEDEHFEQPTLYEFVKTAWHLVEPEIEFIDGWHIRVICDHLEAVFDGRIENLLMNIPPGTMKSLLTCVFWPVWAWIYKPETRWLFGTYGDDLVVRDSRRRREIMQSEWFQRRWGKRFHFVDDQNQKTHYQNNRSGWMIATTVRGGGTGIHPDFVVIDDPHNVKQSLSAVMREEALTWFDGTIGSRGIVRGVRIVVIMQRLHERDLSQHIIEKGTFVHICLPMRAEPNRMRPTPLGFMDEREEGTLLWPEGMPESKVKKLEDNVGVLQAPGQVQQRPAAAGGFIFRIIDFRYFTVRDLYPGEPVPKAGLPAVFELHCDNGRTRRYFAWDCFWLQTVDTALKIKETSNFTVIGTFVITPDGDLLAYDIARDKLEVPKQFGFVCAQYAKYPWCSPPRVEDTAGGISVLQQARTVGVQMLPIAAIADKVTRANQVATAYQNHKVFHRQGAPWLQAYEDELLHFPTGSHDDQVDVTSDAGRLMVERAMQSLGIREASEDDLQEIDELAAKMRRGEF